MARTHQTARRGGIRKRMGRGTGIRRDETRNRQQITRRYIRNAKPHNPPSLVVVIPVTANAVPSEAIYAMTTAITKSPDQCLRALSPGSQHSLNIYDAPCVIPNNNSAGRYSTRPHPWFAFFPVDPSLPKPCFFLTTLDAAKVADIILIQFHGNEKILESARGLCGVLAQQGGKAFIMPINTGSLRETSQREVREIHGRIMADLRLYDSRPRIMKSRQLPTGNVEGCCQDTLHVINSARRNLFEGFCNFRINPQGTLQGPYPYVHVTWASVEEIHKGRRWVLRIHGYERHERGVRPRFFHILGVGSFVVRDIMPGLEKDTSRNRGVYQPPMGGGRLNGDRMHVGPLSAPANGRSQGSSSHIVGHPSRRRSHESHPRSTNGRHTTQDARNGNVNIQRDVGDDEVINDLEAALGLDCSDSDTDEGKDNNAEPGELKSDLLPVEIKPQLLEEDPPPVKPSVPLAQLQPHFRREIPGGTRTHIYPPPVERLYPGERPVAIDWAQLKTYTLDLPAPAIGHDIVNKLKYGRDPIIAVSIFENEHYKRAVR